MSGWGSYYEHEHARINVGHALRDLGWELVNYTPQVAVDVNASGFTAEIAAFVEAIRKGKPSPVRGEQALITQRILDGIYASGAAGKEVKV